MPELPEIEAFRQVLLPLVAKEQTSEYRCRFRAVPNQDRHGEIGLSPNEAKFLSSAQLQLLDDNQCYVTDVIRKGKLLCMILDLTISVFTDDNNNKNGKKARKQQPQRAYLFLHMGMTGRISSPTTIHGLKSMKDEETYPPYHTHLTLSTNVAEASYSDPRKFGKVQLVLEEEQFQKQWKELAPDALSIFPSKFFNTEPGALFDSILQGLIEKAVPIKKILMEQKPANKGVVSGVGNWVADEVLYQCGMHPEQTHLTRAEAHALLVQLSQILHTAVDCLAARRDFPKDWLFYYRWSNKKAGTKDSKGRVISFVTVGGRTSAIVAAIQKKRACSTKASFQAKPTKPEAIVKATTKTATMTGRKRKVTDDPVPASTVTEEKPRRRSGRKS